MDSSPPGDVAVHRTALQLREVLDRDQYAWHGWYQRHGGSVEFLGDHLAGLQFHGIDVQSICLLVATGVLIVLVWKRCVYSCPYRDEAARVLSFGPLGKS